jgi:uncharacterized cofD-like protein
MRRNSHSARVVAIGGGTGLSTLLRGLKKYVAPHGQNGNGYPIRDLVALVTVTDDGGSSGRLRREYSVLPPGDIRSCMVALSQDETLLSRLFDYRFEAGRGLRGHSFGNLFLTALSNVTGDFARAVQVSGEVLAIRGRIFPSTVQLVALEAVLKNGRVLKGESRIGRTPVRIRRIRLVPRRVHPLPAALEAIAAADLILIGPGSLYTSIIPNLLVSGVSRAIEKSSAACVYIANLMTQPGETRGFSLSDHVQAIEQHTGRSLIDAIIVNSRPVPPDIVRRYKAQGAEPVAFDAAELKRAGARCVSGDLLEVHGVVRHDSARLARLLLDHFVEPRRKTTPRS